MTPALIILRGLTIKQQPVYISVDELLYLLSRFVMLSVAVVLLTAAQGIEAIRY